MTELVPVRSAEAARTVRAAEVVDAVPQLLVGRRLPPTPGDGLVRVVTVVVTDYGGHSREEAAVQVWADWSARFPDVVVRVVHASDGWEPVR